MMAGRPPDLGLGTRASMRAHWASVRSVGYGCLDIPASYHPTRFPDRLLDGRRFHYRDWGDPSTPPLVLLHAYLMHARTWDTVARTGLLLSGAGAGPARLR